MRAAAQTQTMGANLVSVQSQASATTGESSAQTDQPPVAANMFDPSADERMEDERQDLAEALRAHDEAIEAKTARMLSEFQMNLGK